VAKGMTFLHSMSPPIMHRDLKTPNIMVSVHVPFSFALEVLSDC
jgi:serine/threonine protein kinase